MAEGALTASADAPRRRGTPCPESRGALCEAPSQGCRQIGRVVALSATSQSLLAADSSNSTGWRSDIVPRRAGGLIEQTVSYKLCAHERVRYSVQLARLPECRHGDTCALFDAPVVPQDNPCATVRSMR